MFLGLSGPVYYPNSLCPAIFKHARLESLYLNNLTLNNRPNFISLEKHHHNEDPTRLDCFIRSLYIQSSTIALDTSLIDPDVFKHVEKISIEFTNLTRIDRGALAPLKYLRQVNLWLDNLKSFIRSSDNQWLVDLNHDQDEVDVNSELVHQRGKYLFHKQIFLELRDESLTDYYDYPEEDFCLFKLFPHSKLVFPVVQTASSLPPLNCSCTLAWLLQFHRFTILRDIKTRSVMNCFTPGTNFSDIVRRCDFDNRLKTCFSNSTDSLPSGYLRSFLVRRDHNLHRSMSSSASFFSTSSCVAFVFTSSFIFYVFIYTGS